jgi:hypothetical protein
MQRTEDNADPKFQPVTAVVLGSPARYWYQS